MLAHLQRLTRSFVYAGERISYVHVYARPLGTEITARLAFVTAQESGFEGIACLDDVARAAMLALRTYEMLRAHDAPEAGVALRMAQDWLRFVTYMQEPDGRFTNFIVDDTGAKNSRGQTSRAGGSWWTARAMWALATAWRVTGDEAYLRAFLRGHLAPTPDLKIKGVQALALMEIYQKEPQPRLRRRIATLCDAIGGGGPGYFRNSAGEVDVALWGYHQLQAMARAGRLFARLDYVRACEETVRTLVEPAIADGFYHVYPRQQDGQCAYDVSPLTLGLEELYRATGHPSYRTLALICAAWLDGNNPAGIAPYDPTTGCCADGIDAGVLSPDRGAESAIEAGFMELARDRLQGGWLTAGPAAGGANTRAAQGRALQEAGEETA